VDQMVLRRRDFLFFATTAIVAERAFAQTNRPLPRLCFLTFDRGTAEAPAERFKGFFERLRELGYVHPQSLHIDYIVSLRCGPPFADRQDQGRFCFAAAVMRSVHKFSYGHKFERTAATPVVA